MRTKTAIVSGGAQGIGKAIAQTLAADDYQVFILDVDREAGKETSEESGEQMEFIPCDVSREAEIQSAVQRVLARAGHIDALVNNAGVSEFKPFESLSLEDWNRVLAINLTSAFLLAKHCTPYLRKNNGAIVNIASTRAHMSEPDSEAYAASKGGLVALTHALAMSLGPEIRVNSISPGWIDVTPFRKSSQRQPARLTFEDHNQHPAGRVGIPGDIAALTAFLLSDKAGFITGQDFIVDGGMTRKMIYV